MAGHGACGTAQLAGQRVIVEDVLESPIFSNPADLESMVRIGVRGVQSTPLRAPSGEVLGMFSTHTRAPLRLHERTLCILDLLAAHAVTSIERQRALEELRERRARLAAERTFIETVLDTQQAFVAVLDVQGRLVRDNRALEAVHGPVMRQWVGTRQWLTRFSEGVGARMDRAIEALGDGQRWVEFEAAGVDGQEHPRHVLIRTSALRDASGRVECVIATALDLTQQRSAERKAQANVEATLHLQRLQTASELTSVLAHELNQPLAAVRYDVSGAAQQLRKPEVDRAALGQVLEGIDGIARTSMDIILHTRRLFVRDAFEPRPVQLNDVIRAAQVLVEPAAQRQNVRMRAELEADLPLVAGVEVQVEQVVINLLRNAVEAIAGQDAGCGDVVVRSQRAGDQVQVTVSDTGPGLSAEEAAGLFEVRKSRKADGLGMGLLISRRLIEEHRGRLWVEPHVPGAVLHFELPMA